MKDARTMRQLIAAIAAVFLGFAALGATYYVNPESGDDDNTGTSSAAPFKTIQGALNKAGASSTVYLADGTYYLDEVITQMQKNTYLISSSGNRDACIVDGQNKCACIYSSKSGLTLSGITFRNGYNTSTNLYASGGIGYGSGSGSLTVSNCVIRNCRRVASSRIDYYTSGKLAGQPIRGGGISVYCAADNGLIVDTIIEDCHVVAHQDADEDKLCTVLGGGIYVYRFARIQDTIVRNCSVSNNTETANPEMAACGGGIANNNPLVIDSCIVSNCHALGGEKFIGNMSSYKNGHSPSGGGIYLVNSASMITNTLVSGCSAHRMGGGILVSDGTVVGCTARGNRLCPTSRTSTYMGGGGIGVYKGATKAVIRNCLVEDNVATNAENVVVGSGGVLLRGKSTMSDTVIRNNVSDRYAGLHLYCTGITSVSNCVIAGNVATNVASGIGMTAYPTNVVIDTLLVVSNRHTRNASYGCFYFGGTSGDYPLDKCTIRNSAFIGNQSGSSGDGWLGQISIPSTMFGDDKYLIFDHCTFAGNRMSYNKARNAIYFSGADTANNTRILGCTFADNRTPKGIGGFGASSTAGEPNLEYCFCDFDTLVTFSDENHNVDGSNLSLASVFEDAANGNFRPAKDSPLIDAGGGFADWMGTRSSDSPVVRDLGEAAWRCVPVGDYGIRIDHGVATPRASGNASDIGAYERSSESGTSYTVSDSKETQVTSVVVSDSWLGTNVPPGKTLNDNAVNGFPYWKCYVLGLTPNDANSLPIIKGVQNAKPEKLAFALGNVNYNADSGVAAEYTIKESTEINGTYTEKATNTVGQVVEFDLPDEGNLHYYQGVIRYRDEQ